MFFLPLFHKLANRRVLVIGAGTTATRKLRWLVRTEATLTVVADKASDAVRAWAEEGLLTLVEERIERRHFEGDALALVLSATDDATVNQFVYDEAVKRNVPVNCVDDPERCTVTFPAIVDRAPVFVAISSLGQAPSLARVVRGWIEQRLPQHLGVLARAASAYRQRVKARFGSVEERMAFWDRALAGPVADKALQNDEAGAREALDAMLAEEAGPRGHVALVGAGPGDPELITLKALRRIQQADVVLYDKLANPVLLDYARRDAECIYVGKQGPKPGQDPSRPDNRSNQQGDINELILTHARAGRRVVRLKGGDPYIYGRGGEEVAALAEAGYEVEVVPGITASLGAASYAGIPLTHRELSQSVRFVTGHRVENTVNLDWPEMGKPNQTLVIYMGLVGLPRIMERLMSFGCPPDRPVALVEHATMPEQRVLVCTVETAAATAAASELSGPTVAIVGEVVALRETLVP